MTADLNAAANQLTADIMAEVEASDWLRGRLAAAWDAGYGEGASEWDGVMLGAREIAAASNPYREVAP